MFLKINKVKTKRHTEWLLNNYSVVIYCEKLAVGNTNHNSESLVRCIQNVCFFMRELSEVILLEIVKMKDFYQLYSLILCDILDYKLVEFSKTLPNPLRKNHIFLGRNFYTFSFVKIFLDGINLQVKLL